MNNQNSSKQVLLSIIGIAILVVAVVGVSFAFFNYSHVGDENNTVTTGTVFFNFIEGSAIKLTDQFPMDDDSGKALVNDDTGNGVLKFDVVGHNTAKSDITYTIYALEGDAPEDEVHTQKLANTDIKLYLKTADAATGNLTENKIATPTTVQSLITAQGNVTFNDTFDSETSLKLATGKITGNSNTNTKHTYELRMWISDNVQIYNEKDGQAPTAKEGAGVYDQDKFGSMYYSLKLHIEANDTAAVQ